LESLRILTFDEWGNAERFEVLYIFMNKVAVRLGS
jgi:hypothetical protein